MILPSPLISPDALLSEALVDASTDAVAVVVEAEVVLLEFDPQAINDIIVADARTTAKNFFFIKTLLIINYYLLCADSSVATLDVQIHVPILVFIKDTLNSILLKFISVFQTSHDPT